MFDRFLFRLWYRIGIRRQYMSECYCGVRDMPPMSDLEAEAYWQHHEDVCIITARIWRYRDGEPVVLDEE